jgi:hypothetical protein
MRGPDFKPSIAKRKFKALYFEYFNVPTAYPVGKVNTN